MTPGYYFLSLGLFITFLYMSCCFFSSKPTLYHWIPFLKTERASKLSLVIISLFSVSRVCFIGHVCIVQISLRERAIAFSLFLPTTWARNFIQHSLVYCSTKSFGNSYLAGIAMRTRVSTWTGHCLNLLKHPVSETIRAREPLNAAVGHSVCRHST